MPEVIEVARCSDCDEIVRPDCRSEDPNGNVICDSCYENNYFTCQECDRFYDNDEYQEDGRCVNCLYDEDDRYEFINDASYMPTLIFSKESWENTLFQGIELEIELPDSFRPANHADNFRSWLVKNKLERFIYFKEDGSLDNGYEIVSHPFTSRSRHKLMNWYKVLKYLRQSGAKAFKTKTCGLHVHVNKSGLSFTDILKLKLFFSRNQGMIERVAGRLENTYCEYQRFGLAEYKDGSVSCDTRYVAVNVNNSSRKSTVEFRVFKSTLTYSRFIACLQFVEACCEFVKVHGAPAIAGRDSWLDFRQYVIKAGCYQQLVKHIRKVGA